MLVFAGVAAAQTAPVATAPAGPAPVVTQTPSAQIVVTGTRIHGVAPVGSALIQVGQQEIKESGLTSTAQLLYDVPSILSLGAGEDYNGGGGAGQGTATVNSLTYSNAPNMRGFGVQATLSLVNGHRMAYEGANMNEFDGDNYPVQMLSRVEIVQDGTSPLYGADAIAGTINYILRSPVDTAEAYGGLGWAKGQDTWYQTDILGHTWNEGTSLAGGFIASYQHTYQSAFKASSEPGLYTDDYRPYGGTGSLFSTPANIQVGNSFYSVPTGQNGTALTLSQLGASPNYTNSWTGYDAIPEETADRFALNWNQNITNWLQVFGDGLYVHRTVFLDWPGGGTDNYVTEAVPNSNPFSPCNPTHYAGGAVTGPAALLAACGTGSLNVLYNDVLDVGAPIRTANVTSWDWGGGVHVTLPFDWKLTAQAYDEYHQELSDSSDFSPGVPPAGTFNFFCGLQSPTCNTAAIDAATKASSASLDSATTYEDQDYSVNVDGPLFRIPGGEVRLAVGGEFYNANFINQNSFGENVNDPRQISSGYGELFVPLVGPDNAIPGISKLEIDVAGRIDSYTQVGRTENPKIGINWYPIEDLKLHGSWGTSFRAPGLADDDPHVQHGWLYNSLPGDAISSGICSACQAIPNAAIYQVIGGANEDLTPETSESYSAGADWTPKSIPGLTLSANYWWTSYNKQIGYPCYNAGDSGCINQGYYNQYIIYNPAYFPALAANNPKAFFGDFPTSPGYINLNNANCSAVYGKTIGANQTLYNDLVNCINQNGDTALFGPPGGSAPSQVLALEDGHRINGGSTIGDGLDLSGSYTMHNDWGTWKIGFTGEYIDKWLVSVSEGAPLINYVNQFGYPLRFTERTELTWNQDYSFGNLLASAFVNYENPYKMAAALLPAGVSPSYGNISAYTTVDLTLRYDTKSSVGPWLAHDVTVTLSVQNLFGAKPPLVLNQTADVSGPGTLFDPANANPLGRIVQIEFGKKF